MANDSTRADKQDDEVEDLTPEEGSAGEVTGGAARGIGLAAGDENGDYIWDKEPQ